MKYIFSFLLITSLLFSCKSNTKQVVKKDSTKIDNTVNNQTQELIKKFKPIIEGVWVKEDYVEAISTTMSPYNSQSTLLGVAAFEIGSVNIESDSIHVGYSLNNHEGSDFTIYFTAGKKPTSLEISLPDYDKKSNFYELGYNIKGNNTALILYHYNKNNKIIDSTSYLRVADKSIKNEDIGWGIDYITNKTLIAGSYSTVDSAGTISKIKFTGEGNVSGF